MDSPVNMAIMGNPINWVIIVLMIMFAALISESLFQLIAHSPCGCHKNSTEHM